MIYFIACPAANAVKIGITSGRVYERMNLLQVGCPLPLEMLAAFEGSKADEVALHLRFANLRIRGEWFHLTAELRACIAGFPKPEKPASGWHGQKRNRQTVAA